MAWMVGSGYSPQMELSVVYPLYGVGRPFSKHLWSSRRMSSDMLPRLKKRSPPVPLLGELLAKGSIIQNSMYSMLLASKSVVSIFRMMPPQRVLGLARLPSEFRPADTDEALTS